MWSKSVRSGHKEPFNQFWTNSLGAKFVIHKFFSGITNVVAQFS